MGNLLKKHKNVKINLFATLADFCMNYFVVNCKASKFHLADIKLLLFKELFEMNINIFILTFVFASNSNEQKQKLI